MRIVRMGVVVGALTTALACTVPAAFAGEAEYPAVNGHTDDWVNGATPTVVYQNGLTDTDPARVKEAFEQCKSQSVSCAATTVGTPERVTKWFDVENTGTGTGPLENCGQSSSDIKQQIGGMHAFAWGWNVGGSIDIELTKGVGIGASAQYNETNTETKTGSIDITVKPGERGMLKVGHDMERIVSDVTVQGGKFGGAKISGLRTEVPLKEGAKRAAPDIVPCGQKLLMEQ
ncbi:hypothetical protein HEK616_78140 (plasmid) [Streptomyces nigrescens]|uniref:Secreted protein n=2 Tax=Streptomyces TaxID=1883 RepID=A0ABM8A6J2_STRNI|nr:hypothetical protein [Streptomyces nigrescens]MEE4418963.1 hypothetical protein [Streptomyces sp. DSM 41528]BDM74327.1 hypothetical protein HEK616_78140 [Streptomyces nigrescens]